MGDERHFFVPTIGPEDLVSELGHAGHKRCERLTAWRRGTGPAEDATPPLIRDTVLGEDRLKISIGYSLEHAIVHLPQPLVNFNTDRSIFPQRPRRVVSSRQIRRNDSIKTHVRQRGRGLSRLDLPTFG